MSRSLQTPSVTTPGGPPVPARPLTEIVDLTVVADIREAVANELSEARRGDGDLLLDPEDESARSEGFIWKHLDAYSRRRASEGEIPLALDEERAVFQRVKADLFGLGGFETYLFDPRVENIFVNGCDRVFVNRSGAKEAEQVPPVAESDEALIELVNRWAARLGRTERRFDVSNPRLDMRLPGGFRLHAIMEVTHRPTITIRCPYHQRVSLADLQALGTLDSMLVEFLTAAVKARFNIIIAGGTGTGKTTMLRAMLHQVPAWERIITIEDTAELGLAAFEDDHPNVVEMETRQANLEGVGELTMLELTRECLRMSPDRVVLGEVRGAEALYMLKAMSQGNDGSMCTVHADSAHGVADRIRGYCAEGADLPISVIDGFYRNAVDLVVHLRVLNDRTRVVSSIVEVEKSRADSTAYNELWAPVPEALAVPSTRPSQQVLERLQFAGFRGFPWQG